MRELTFQHPRHAHELTSSCDQQLPLLSYDWSRVWLVDAMDQAPKALLYSLLCYVMMPEQSMSSFIHGRMTAMSFNS